MNDQFKQIKKLIKLMRSEGVTSLKASGVEIQLGPKQTTSKVTKAQDTPDATPAPMYTDEQTLFWSAQGLDNEGH
jgi:5'-3' exonuclease